MALTYTSTRDRDRRRGFPSGAAARPSLALIAVTLVSLLAFALCYAGRMRAFAVTEAASGRNAPVDLSRVTSVDRLEPALAAAFPNAADRRLAARELLRALGVEGRRSLANVGALARIEIPLAEIDRARGLDVLAARARDVRARAKTAGAAVPAAMPLFTSADIAALKPGFTVRMIGEHRRTVMWCALAFLACFPVTILVWRIAGIPGDRLLLAAAGLLAALGFVVMLSRPDPLRDTLLIVRYTVSVVIGAGVFIAASLIRIRRASFLRLGYLSLAAAVMLSIVLIVFGSGPGASGAKVNLGPVQPIEAIRLLIAIFLASYLGRRWELLRQLRETEVGGRSVPRWLDLPRVDHMLPLAGGVGLALLLFFALRDLGPALLLSLTFMTMLAVARAGPGVVLTGIVLLAGGFYTGYWLGISRTLAARVAMWQSPWDNAIRGGDQIAHAIWSMASGGTLGTGLGLGDTRYLPAGHTDLVLAAIGEELGALGVIAAAAACVVIAWRGIRIARAASTDTAFFLAVAMTLSLVTPMAVMAAGMLGVLPLTGVATPFLSYGGSAMLANFAALGLLAAIRSDDRRPVDAAAFAVPIRWMGRSLAAAAVCLLVFWARVQIVSADHWLVEPQLGVQADGGRRYQYNPRVLDAVSTLPRGSIVDRRGVPLAADAATVQAAGAELARMHVDVGDACPGRQARCYPLDGVAFHLLGDERTRANWAATNTSYVERDAEDRLRGFDDRAMSIRAGAHGALVLRRDYRDVVPLVRHRWEPDHESVRALRTTPRVVSVTIDARLQSRVAALTAKAAGAAHLAHAAAVVLDANTGELLASVSVPWPGAEMTAADLADAMLDRARYGLYPPGSTFKLITAAAALRQDPDASQIAFTCSRLPNNRVGVRLPGWGRPIRDDVLDHEPHGTLTMKDGLVRSCNAYFAQLALRLGAAPLASTADVAGISYPTAGPANRVRESLPYAGYGQGPVLATPLRLARVAAAIGTDGVIREPSIVADSTAPEPKRFLSQAAAAKIAGYMREAVTSGTGRLLRTHAVPIAGKTGTAEIDGAPSHAWFVGFAPAGPATRRIAFAVLLENAGYGGGRAADLAGQIVTAAASLGMVK